MDQTTAALAKKLRLSPETRLLALNPPEDYLAALRAGGFVVSLAPISESDQYGAVHIFVRDQAEAQAAFTSATAALQPGGVFWVMWPKQGSGVATDLTRDSLAAVALAQGWGPVSNVSVDATWSALRLRPEAEVKRSGRGPGQ